METVMFECEIDPQFLAFLELLEEKEEGIPLTYYQESIDFLIALFGDGDCRDHLLGGIIVTGTDILLKIHPRVNENHFAGIKVWGGIQGFLSRSYREKYGSGYEEFVRQHNTTKAQIPIEEILNLLVERMEVKERYTQYQADIKRYLGEQNPVIHIPLLPPEKLPRLH